MALHPYPGYYSLIPTQWQEVATCRPPLFSVNCWHIGPVTDYARTSCLETFWYCAAEKNTSGRSLKWSSEASGSWLVALFCKVSWEKPRWLQRLGPTTVEYLRCVTLRHACHLIMATVCTGPWLRGASVREPLSSTYASIGSPPSRGVAPSGTVQTFFLIGGLEYNQR